MIDHAGVAVGLSPRIAIPRSVRFDALSLSCRAVPEFNDPRIDSGIALFNAREFFACHDVFEDYWDELVGPERRFFQGLIQAAVALFHFEGGNLGGALRMYRSARTYLLPWSPELAGIQVDPFIDELDRCFAELNQPHTGWPAHVRLNDSLIPRITRRLTD